VWICFEEGFFFQRPLFVDERLGIILGHPIQIENQTARQDLISDSKGGVFAKNAIRSGGIAKLHDQQVFRAMPPIKELKKSYVQILPGAQKRRETAFVPIFSTNKGRKKNSRVVLGKPVCTEEVLPLGVQGSQKFIAT
jgi:hypothetical protein